MWQGRLLLQRPSGCRAAQAAASAAGQRPLASARWRRGRLAQAALGFVCGLLYLPAAPVAAGERPSTNAVSTTGLPAPAPARVIIAQDPRAIKAFTPRLEVIRALVDEGLTNLTGKPTPPLAWRSLLSTQEVIGLKVFSAPGPNSGTHPAVVEAVVQSLLAAGVPAKQLIIWDKQLGHLRLAGFCALADRYGLRAAGSQEAGYDTNQFYESPLLGQLVWADHEFGQKGEGVGRKSFVSKLVSQQMTKIINISPLLNHNLAGVSGNLYGLAFGSVDNTLRFAGSAERLATAVPEIYALPVVGDRVVLNIVDALVAQYHGEERSLLHYSGVPSQLRFSTDPVALDVLSIQELERLRAAAQAPPVKPSLQLYQNAAVLELGVADPRNIQVETVTPTLPSPAR
jgi:hypothetical protein